MDENRRNINLLQNNSSYGLLQNNAYGHELELFSLIILLFLVFTAVYVLFLQKE